MAIPFSSDKESFALCIGGSSREELREKLLQQGVGLNEYAELLLASEDLVLTAEPQSIRVVMRTPQMLGLADGGTMPQILARAREQGLMPCPHEVGPYLRLQYRDQPEGFLNQPVREKRAPFGALTIASEKLREDPDFPRGIYLRCIEGTLWLRGYRADDEHQYDAEDAFVFSLPAEA